MVNFREQFPLGRVLKEAIVDSINASIRLMINLALCRSGKSLVTQVYSNCNSRRRACAYSLIQRVGTVALWGNCTQTPVV